MRVKICGITNLEDALFACKAGADALGFVFYPKSPRFITSKTAKKIIAKLPPFVQKIALFVNETPKNINKIMKETKMNIAQIHFEANEDLYDSLDFDYLKVLRIKQKEDLSKIPKDEYVLVDAFVESYGGEGKRIMLDWFDDIECSKIIIAGGLNEINVKELKGYGFYGVDVSSGVELKKGKKDYKKITNFIKAAKNI